MHSVT